MNDKNSSGTPSSEDGIGSVSLDPELTAEGIGGLGEEYLPRPQTTQFASEQRAGQDVYDPDNLAYHAIASRG